MAYDASEHDDGDRIVIGSNKHARQSKPEQVSSPHIESRMLAHTFKRSTLSAQTFHDGRLVLTGFVLSDKPVAEDRW
jgi:G patch domain-containing protein 1